MQLEMQLRHFRGEVDTAAHAFFLWKAINNVAASDRAVHRGMNEQALSWNILTHSLQVTFFIALGRLFDTDGESFSVHSFLRSCIDGIDQFSKDALRARKLAAVRETTTPDWLDDYIACAYVPSADDFQRLRGEVSKRQKEYEEIYRPIRNMVFAHKDAATMESVEALFGKTNIGQIEGLLAFLHQIQEIVWDLLYNGRLTKIGDFSFNAESSVSKDAEALLARFSERSEQ